MPLHRPGIALLPFFALLGLGLTSRADDPVRPPALRAAVVPGASQLRAYGGRGALSAPGNDSGKLDAALADIARHAAAVRPGQELEDLRALNPAARFSLGAVSGQPMVAIDAITRGNPDELRRALENLGLERSAVYANDVGGWLPVAQLAAVTARPELHAIRAAMRRTRAGAVASQGDFAQGSAALRQAHSNLTGSGVTVGVLSDSFDCYAQYEKAGSGVPASGLNGFASNGILADAQTDQSSGDLSSSVTVLEEANCLDFGAPTFLPFTDEGRAMLQIVHDVAPGAALAFRTADNTEADFAAGIGKLASAGAKVIVDDTGYFDEPFFQDGIVAQAIDTVESQGVAYFSAAGNDGVTSYDNVAPVFVTPPPSSATPGELLLNFDPTGATITTALSVTIPALVPGQFLALVVEWDQPYVTGAPQSSGATSQIDLCATGGNSGDPIIIDVNGNTVTCTGLNALGIDPVQILIIGNPANATVNSAAETLNVSIGLGAGSPAPGRIKLALDGDGAPIIISAPFTLATVTPTVQGHPSATGAMAVGAAFFPNTPRCGVTPAVLNRYSSRGGEPILFDVNGSRLASPEIRTKPDLVGPDGVNTTFFGDTLINDGVTDASSVSECANNASYPNFFGTSAAAPHVAGAAALLLQSNSALTPAQIYHALEESADPMGSTIPNNDSGYGFVRVDQAIAHLPVATATATTATSSGSHGGGGGFDWTCLILLGALTAMRLRTPKFARPTAGPWRSRQAATLPDGPRQSMPRGRQTAGAPA